MRSLWCGIVVMTLLFIPVSSWEEARGDSGGDCSALAGAGVELTAGSGGLVVKSVGAEAANAGIETGDRINQINGFTVRNCADAGQAITSARRHSLAVLLLLGRKGRQIAAVVKPGLTHSRIEKQEAARAGAAEVQLPELKAGDGVVEELPALALKAAKILARLEKVARIHGVLSVYTRRLSEAQTALGELGWGQSRSGKDLARVVDEIIEYHRVAQEMWRFKIERSSELRYDRRTLRRPVPFFSNSRVTDWINRYPFLHATVVVKPREVSLVMPGEGAGLWDCDGALELMWAKARQKRRELERWARGIDR